MIARLRTWYYKRRVRGYYYAIMGYPAGCGHNMLKTIHPHYYIGLRKWYGKLKAIDPDIPDIWKWAE